MCLSCFIKTTSLQNRYAICQNNDEQLSRDHETYTFGSLYLGIVSRHLKNLERHHLIVVHTLPNFGHLGVALCALSPLHDAFKFI